MDEVFRDRNLQRPSTIGESPRAAPPKAPPCFHGGASFGAIGPEFDRIERRHSVIAADVLDAWFPPSPLVITAVTEDLAWLLSTSPPTQCEGMVQVIARTRGVRPADIVAGAGSSQLIFLAFRHWLNPSSRALILDPTYGEYAHVLQQVVGCTVDRLDLSPADSYRVDLDLLAAKLETPYDLVVVVNPNSPTGQFVRRSDLEATLERASPSTRVWIDETYVDYLGPDQSLERFAASSERVVVCKSMSKVYSLSGARAAYLCGPEAVMADLRKITPPWAVSLPAQVAAVAALQDPAYYAARYAETHRLRTQLAAGLSRIEGWEVLDGCANFLLCHLPPQGPSAATLVETCRLHGLFIRNADEMGRSFAGRAVRIAVKDVETNTRILATIRQVVEGTAAPTAAKAGPVGSPRRLEPR